MEPLRFAACVRVEKAMQLNGAHLSVDEDEIRVRTHPDCGGYSALIPVSTDLEAEGPLAFDVSLEVEHGAIGLAAVSADLKLLSERVWASGKHAGSLLVPEGRAMAGLLIRNASAAGDPSSGALLSIRERPFGEGLLRNWPTSDARLRLPMRRRSQTPFGGTEAHPERGGAPVVTSEILEARRSAVIVIDAWSDHECPGWAQRAHENIVDRLVPALSAFRRAGFRIFHAPHDRAPHPAIAPRPNEVLIEGSLHANYIAEDLRALGADRLVYMGYSTNYCLMTRPIGVINMWRERFNIIMVRDATIALESPETASGFWAHKVMVDFVESSIGATIGVDEVIDAVAEVA